jgi:16S rRNA (cytosine1402-N4)-methyltransferase
MTAYHVPVLAQESISGLNIQKDGIYVDATFGGGGHTRLILNELDKGKLAAFDRDSDAQLNVPEDTRFTLFPHNYRFISNFLNYAGMSPVDGILADLGVSSHQFDQAERGFSFRFDGPLDLRMDTQHGVPAHQIVNEYEENQLIHIFSAYGEIKNSRTLASALIKARQQKPIASTQDMVEALKSLLPKNRENKYLAQVFQALRIEANQELDSLRDFLVQCPDLLKKGGRLVIISYHSLEDRLVKNFLRSGNLDGKEEKDIFGQSSTPFKLISRKAIQAQEEEIQSNNRARSARLRIAERI